MPAAGVWWGSTRGSPRAGLMQGPGSEVVGMAPEVVQQFELRGRASSGEYSAGSQGGPLTSGRVGVGRVFCGGDC